MNLPSYLMTSILASLIFFIAMLARASYQRIRCETFEIVLMAFLAVIGGLMWPATMVGLLFGIVVWSIYKRL